MKKKVFAILLSLAMTVTVMPAFAEEAPLPEEALVIEGAMETDNVQLQPVDEEKSAAGDETSEEQEKISQNIDENADVNKKLNQLFDYQRFSGIPG